MIRVMIRVMLVKNTNMGEEYLYLWLAEMRTSEVIYRFTWRQICPLELLHPALIPKR